MLKSLFIKKSKKHLSDSFKSELRSFVYYYTNGTLPFVIGDNSILGDLDYRELLKTEASLVEMVFAIYSNNIQMDKQGNVLNQTHSMRRAAQYIRQVCGHDNYQVVPRFEDWETYLH